MITLKEAELETKYEVIDVHLCEPCLGDSSTCGVVSMMEKGIIPGHVIQLERTLGNLMWVSIQGEGQFVIQDSKSDQIFIQKL